MSKIAVAQMNSTADGKKNEKQAITFIEMAASQNATLIAFPENFLFLGAEEKFSQFSESIPGPSTRLFQNLAKTFEISILLGSIPEKAESGKVYNTAVLIDKKGELVAAYRKIHLFDLHTAEIKLQESQHVERGSHVVVAQHEIGVIGFSICYDLRFPGLFSKLRLAGAQIVFVPSAFTLHTGKDHWFPLLRARAIENQFYVVAPAQFGRHGGSRISYGKSSIIDPWGNVIACASEQESLIFGEIDLAYLKKIRQGMPVVSHRVEGID